MPCVRPSVHPSLQKSGVTFDSLDGPARNFQGPLNSAQVIFGRVTWTPGPSGSGPDPQKGFSAKSISSGGFGAGGSCHTFFKLGQRGEQNNVGSRILIFCPQPKITGLEGGAGRGAIKILELQHFYKMESTKISCRSLLVLCNFLIQRTPRAPGVPPVPGGMKRKDHNWGIVVFFIQGTSPPL